MQPGPAPIDLDLDELTHAVEAFNRVFIRLAAVQRLSFTTLSVLHTLERSRPLSLKELTATEQVSQSAMTQLVTRLEREGLVQRAPDPRDGRGVLVRITATGAELVRARRRSRLVQLRPLLDQLTPTERRSIAAALPALHRIAELGTVDALPCPLPPKD